MWQEFEQRRHICHSWQDRDQRMISVMTLMLILLAVAVALIVTTIRSVRHDAPSARPRSHRVDTDFVAPANRTSYDRAA